MTNLASKVLLLGLAGVAAASAANASPADSETTAVVVRYSPEALTTDRGAQALYHRLTIAAEKVCENPVSEGLRISPAELECRKQALANAVEKIHNTRLAAAYATRTKSG
jgi:UrcA family protein